MKRALAAAALVLLASPALAQLETGDQWWARDKQKHLTYSLALGVGASLLPAADSQAFVLAMLPGLLKEAHDATVPGRGASAKDLVWDAVGAYAGVKLGRFVLRPQRGGLFAAYAATY